MYSVLLYGLDRPRSKSCKYIENLLSIRLDLWRGSVRVPSQQTGEVQKAPNCVSPHERLSSHLGAVRRSYRRILPCISSAGVVAQQNQDREENMYVLTHQS